MNIEATEMPDILSENIDKIKVKLADSLIDKIKPLVNLGYEKRNNIIKELELKILQNKQIMESLKNNLVSIDKEKKKKNKTIELLENTLRLVSKENLSKLASRNELVTLINISDKVSIDRLEEHIRFIKNML